MELNNIDFCVISTAYAGNTMLMVFFAHHGVTDVTEEIWHSKEYPHLKNLIQELSFTEIDFGVFESKNTGDQTSLQEILLNAGLNYSNKLESNILNQLRRIIGDISPS